MVNSKKVKVVRIPKRRVSLRKRVEIQVGKERKFIRKSLPRTKRKLRGALQPGKGGFRTKGAKRKKKQTFSVFGRPEFREERMDEIDAMPNLAGVGPSGNLIPPPEENFVHTFVNMRRPIGKPSLLEDPLEEAEFAFRRIFSLDI